MWSQRFEDSIVKGNPEIEINLPNLPTIGESEEEEELEVVTHRRSGRNRKPKVWV